VSSAHTVSEPTEEDALAVADWLLEELELPFEHAASVAVTAKTPHTAMPRRMSTPDQLSIARTQLYFALKNTVDAENVFQQAVSGLLEK